jgi:hypothetical protein
LKEIQQFETVAWNEYTKPIWQSHVKNTISNHSYQKLNTPWIINLIPWETDLPPAIPSLQTTSITHHLPHMSYYHQNPDYNVYAYKYGDNSNYSDYKYSDSDELNHSNFNHTLNYCNEYNTTNHEYTTGAEQETSKTDQGAWIQAKQNQPSRLQAQEQQGQGKGYRGPKCEEEGYKDGVNEQEALEYKGDEVLDNKGYQNHENQLVWEANRSEHEPGRLTYENNRVQGHGESNRYTYEHRVYKHQEPYELEYKPKHSDMFTHYGIHKPQTLKSSRYPSAQNPGTWVWTSVHTLTTTLPQHRTTFLAPYTW